LNKRYFIVLPGIYIRWNFNQINVATALATFNFERFGSKSAFLLLTNDQLLSLFGYAWHPKHDAPAVAQQPNQAHTSILRPLLHSSLNRAFALLLEFICSMDA
jgi:hypothetical protein